MSLSAEVCLSPAVIPYYDAEGKNVVILDIFRASSAICAAISFGIKEIIPVREVSEAQEYKNKGFLAAAERAGEIVEGFDFGNSPLAYLKEELKGQTIVLTTSNCTQAIHMIKGAHSILIGSFLNAKAITEHLLKEQKDIILLCAGWKNRFNLEDTIAAGYIAELLTPHITTQCDSFIAARDLYRSAALDLGKYLSGSSHSNRLKHLNLTEDTNFCLQKDIYSEIPAFNGKGISKY